MPTLFERSYRLLNLSDFATYCPPIDLGQIELNCPYERQYVLRMMVRGLQGDQIVIPEELKWLTEHIYRCDNQQWWNGIDHKFIYVTVRHGLVTSVTDDGWHVDGFSMRVPHLPEQNYIYTNSFATEVLEHGFGIPKDFDPMKHHIHQYFQDNADESKIRQLPANHLHIIDPYIVHRRPKNVEGERTFVRISFVPVEIEDDTCRINPLMPARKYGREDIRKRLLRYPEGVEVAKHV